MVQYKDPGLENEDAKKKIEAHSDKGVQQITDAKDKAEDKTRKLNQEQKDTTTESLNPTGDQNKVIQKGQGWTGSINNKDFGSTLNLMRRADKYNNKPVEDMIHYGSYKGSGIQNLGKGYERPKIETMETRAMNQAMQLDTQQKQLAIALQDAINHKDIEAFKQLYEQLYGVQLTTMQAEQAIRAWTQQNQITNVATKDVASWQKQFNRYFDTETLEYLIGLAKEDEQLATLLSNAMYGLPTPNLDERVLVQTRNKIYKDNLAQGKGEIAAMNDANNIVLALNLLNDNLVASEIKQAQSVTKKPGAWSDARGTIKDAKKGGY